MANDESTRRDDPVDEPTAGASGAERAAARPGAERGSARRGGEMRDLRRGIPGKGFDAGTGYGGAGGDSAYSGESSYGGQAGYGGSTTRGAYAGGKFGRPDDPGGPFAGRGEDATPAEPEDEARGAADAGGGEGAGAAPD